MERDLEVMKKGALVLLLLLVSPPAWSLSGQGAIDDARQGLELLLHRDYLGAEQHIKNILREGPEDPLGYFGMMALSQVRNLENFDSRFESLYLQYGGRGRDLAMRIYRNESSTPWELLIAGGIFGVSGFQKAHHSQWMGALLEARYAIGALERVTEKDPSMVDAYLGLGLYNFWRSHYTQHLRFLPFFPDRRETGRGMLVRVREEGTFVGAVAAIALAHLDYQEKRYESVLATAGELLRQYPANTVVRMLQGRALLQLKRYPEAHSEFAQILEEDPTLTKTKYFLALSFAGQRKKDEARRYFKEFLEDEREAPRHWREPVEKALKAVDSEK